MENIQWIHTMPFNEFRLKKKHFCLNILIKDKGKLIKYATKDVKIELYMSAQIAEINTWYSNRMEQWNPEGNAASEAQLRWMGRGITGVDEVWGLWSTEEEYSDPITQIRHW